MTLKFKTQYLKAIRKRYFCGSKKRKTEILNELCEVTGYSRKHAIKILSVGHIEGKKKSGKKRFYSDESLYHLKKLWHLMGRICSKKMKSAIPLWLKFYDSEELNNFIKQELLSMSSSTIDRYLRAYKKQYARMKRTSTRRSKKFKNVIPIKDFCSKATIPGYLQADTVAHCGNSLSGIFIYTMTITDEHTGWTECRAMYGKGGSSPLSAISSSLWSFPFDVISFNSDNGSEFLNREIHNYITKENKLKFTRSRPYKKNDNCHVEQKNFTHVRELFGYERYDFEDLVDSMNIIYQRYFCMIQNYFIPQQKLISKVRIGARYVKKYDTPKTPYQRVLESPNVSRHKKKELRDKFEKLNPIELRAQIDRELKRFKVLHKELKDKKQALVEYYQEIYPEKEAS